MVRVVIATFVALSLACSTPHSWGSKPNAVYDTQGRKVPDTDADTQRVAWRPLDPIRDGISGVGVLNFPWLTEVCTASLIDSGDNNGPAYIMTNGHCNFFEHWGFDPLGANEFRHDLPTSHTAIFNHFVSVPKSERLEYRLKQLTYITESGTDVAFFEIDATLGEMRAKGIKPLKIGSIRPLENSRVRLIGVPLLLVGAEKKSLMISECKVEGVVALKNGIYEAPFSVVHHCSSVPGFSGGPLVSDEGEIVLLNSHGVSDAAVIMPPCSYETTPCEVWADGTKHVDITRNYAQYVDGFAGCFATNGTFDRRLRRCGLPK